jgi:ankyrin repeat protein
VGVVGLLLSRSTEILKVTDNDGKTSLHMAAASGHFDMVQVLIAQGADLTIADKVDKWDFRHKCCVSFDLHFKPIYSIT